MVEYRVFARTQTEYLLQQLDGFLDRPGIGVRAEVLVLLFYRATVVRHAGKVLGPRLRIRCGRRLFKSGRPGVGTQAQVGVALVIPEENVETRLLRLDEVVFEQQGFCLGAHHCGFHAHDLADHVADARAVMALLEVAGDALLQITRLADVQQHACGVEIAVDTGQRRQCRHGLEQLFGMG